MVSRQPKHLGMGHQQRAQSHQNQDPLTVPDSRVSCECKRSQLSLAVLKCSSVSVQAGISVLLTKMCVPRPFPRASSSSELYTHTYNQYKADKHDVLVYLSVSHISVTLTMVFSRPSASLRFLCACLPLSLSGSMSLNTLERSSTRTHGVEPSEL